MIFFLLLVAFTCAFQTFAHETRPAYLEIKETAANHYEIVWRTPTNAGMRLPILLQLPKDARDVAAPSVQELTDSLLERHSIEVSGGLGGKRIDFVGLQGTITDVLVRVQLLDGRSWTTIVRPSQAWLEITPAQGKLAVAGTYVVEGIRHILFGADHLLFVLGLLLIELPLALLSFNIGVEIGQLSFVILILLLERAFRILEIRWPRIVEAVPGYAVGSLGAFWTIQRVAILFGIAR